jgi:hypothetical protein
MSLIDKNRLKDYLWSLPSESPIVSTYLGQSTMRGVETRLVYLDVRQISNMRQATTGELNRISTTQGELFYCNKETFDMILSKWLGTKHQYIEEFCTMSKN